MAQKALYIEWEDSCSVGSRVWTDKEDVTRKGPSLCHSVGFVLKETKDFIALAGHLVGESGDCSGNMVIPRSAVRRLRRLSLPVRRK